MSSGPAVTSQETRASIQTILDDEVYCDRFEGVYDYGNAVDRIEALIKAFPPAPDNVFD